MLVMFPFYFSVVLHFALVICVSYNLNLSIFVLDNVLLINISKSNCNKICFRKLENQLIVEVIVFSKSLSQSQKIKGEWRKEHKTMNKYIIIEEMILRVAGQSQQVPHVHFLSLIPFMGTRSPTNWPARIWVASQLCRWEHCTCITEVMGLNPVEDTQKKKTFQCTYETHWDWLASVRVISSIHLLTTLHKHFFHST